VKPKKQDDRGGYQLYRVDAPIVILEPCFITNKNDLTTIQKRIGLYCDAIVAGVKEYLEKS
jgi:N-acetylmuramoyl-L-alanine amidase